MSESASPSRARRSVCENAAGAHRQEVFAAVGEFAATLSPDDLRSTLGPGLAVLRRASGALQLRLFLVPPRPGERVLAARAGAADGAARTTNLPIRGPGGTLGHLEADWSSERALRRGRPLIEQAARPLASGLRAALAACRDAADRAVAPERDRPTRRRAFLDAVLLASGARRATLITGSDSDAAEPSVLSTASDPSVCSHAFRDGWYRCPLHADGRPRALEGPRAAWPEPCRAMDPRTASPCCIPLGADRQLGGALILDYGTAPPSPVSRDLVPLLTMTRTAEPLLLPPTAPSRGLEIRCLGGFELALHGRPLPATLFGRRKALDLLKILVLAYGRPVARDELVRLLWPGATRTAGANRLHGVVHSLRSAIEPGDGRCSRIYVRQQEEHYLFDPRSPHWLDIEAFSRHEVAATDAERAGHVERAIPHLESALRLYRGDLFDDGRPAGCFELERTEYRRRCLAVVSRLAELSVRIGEPDRAVDCLRRGLRIDPLREDLHQVLIQTLIETGRREEAREQYAECARLLRAELDVEPLPATRRLMRLIGS